MVNAADGDVAWRALDDELDAWHGAGRVATLWWRDDDAVTPTPLLDALLACQARHGVPLCLAVVPATATPALDGRIADAGALVEIAQHGYAHQNHAAATAKKIELGGERPAAHVLSELAVGHQRLSRLPGWLPVLVPPWNRIARHLVPLLPEIGFTGVSTFGPRDRVHPVAGLVQANTHLDPVDWHNGRAFVGEAAALDAAVGHLRARRNGLVDATEPTGLLTHHLVREPATWNFVDAFLARTAAHPAAQWLAARAVFATS